MRARRLLLAVLVSVCALCCAPAIGWAVAPSQFGSLGAEAGQLDGPTGVAVDSAGDVYVADVANERVDKFDASGNFLLAWGWGVADGAQELQTCTNECEAGFTSAGAGGFESPTGVTVDDDPLSDSYGDVYVIDDYHGRVEKFDSSGKFLLMFGGHVNQNGGDVCVAGEACTLGPASQGSADGEFAFWREVTAAHNIAVGPNGAVYVGDEGRVQVFNSTGVWRENVSLSGLSATSEPTALAVDVSGDVYVKDEGVAGVREFEANGAEKGVQFDGGSETVESLALGSSGEVFVGDSNGGFRVLEYDSAGSELASFGSKTVLAPRNYGMAFSPSANELYATQSHCDSKEVEPVCTAAVWVLMPPPPGPLVDGESATPGLRGTATLEATVNPENSETTYHFEYVDDTHFQQNGYAAASSTPNMSLGASFEDQPVNAGLMGLVPGAAYHYRIVATSSKGTVTGADQTVTTIPPARVEGPWASNVAGTSVTLAARIDPLGASTSYRLEYGAASSSENVLSGNVGEGMEYVLVSFHRQDLQAGTTYNYRLVTTSEVGTVEGGDHTFKTQGAGNELVLPDGRAWELVSPPNKEGALVDPKASGGNIQAAIDGSGITYAADGVPMGENIVGNGKPGKEQVLSRRGAGGWRTEDLQPVQSTPALGEPASNLLSSGGGGYGWFTPDLSKALGGPGTATSLSPEAVPGTTYIRNNVDESWAPLFTQANLPSGITLNGGGEPYKVVDVTPDLRHVLFVSPYVLTPDAVHEITQGTEKGSENLYEWSAGQIQLVSVLPHGESYVGSPHMAGWGVGGMGARTVSSDGRRVAWTAKEPYFGGGERFEGLFVRDMVEGKTVRVGGSGARFQTMSSDGSRIFFLEKGELYQYDMNTGLKVSLTNHATVGGAGVMEDVSNVSEDGSYVYFVATGVLADGATVGADNLYLAHDAGGEWSTSYIATLSGEDEKDWHQANVLGIDLQRVSSRVSPNGRFLAFMSQRSLTGYDNIDANSGQPDEEVYLYDAGAHRLACVSCNPTGARPIGILDISARGETLVDPGTVWAETSETRHWLAGNIPGWTELAGFYQSRFLSDDGRLFFTSSDGLVPQDTNGLEDVYEYEPPGVGGCAVGSATFSERSGGCVDLISSGTSSSESAFFDASETGDDVFFITSAHLTAADYDTAYDVYDAHVCSALAPCGITPVVPPACTTGDSCKAAPSPQPEIFGPTPSATFSGVGNVTEEAKTVKAVKHKARRKPKKHAKHKKHRKRQGRKASKSRISRASGKGVRS